MLEISGNIIKSEGNKAKSFPIYAVLLIYYTERS